MYTVTHRRLTHRSSTCTHTHRLTQNKCMHTLTHTHTHTHTHTQNDHTIPNRSFFSSSSNAFCAHTTTPPHYQLLKLTNLPPPPPYQIKSCSPLLHNLCRYVGRQALLVRWVGVELDASPVNTYTLMQSVSATMATDVFQSLITALATASVSGIPPVGCQR